MSVAVPTSAPELHPPVVDESEWAADPGSHVLIALERELACELRVCGVRPSDQDLPRRHRLVAEVAAGGEHFGFLQASREYRFKRDEVSRLEVAAETIAVEMIKERTAQEVVARFEDDLLSGVLDAPQGPDERHIARARRLDLDLRGAWTIAAMTTGDSSIPGSLAAAARRPASMGEQSLSCLRGDLLIVAVAEDGHGHLHGKLCDLTRVATGLGLTLFIGVGSPGRDFAKGLRQARATLRLATQGAAPLTVRYDQLGTLRFLLDVPDATEMIGLVTEQLGALAQNDDARKGQLITTLRVLLDEGGNKPRTAARCHIHLSTLKYRVGQIAKITCRDLRSSQVRFEFMLAFEVLDLLRSAGVDPLAREPVQTLTPAFAAT